MNELLREFTGTDVPIGFSWGLAGPEGASFMLYPTSAHSPDDIKKAKNWLRYTRDVVGQIKIASKEDWKDLYRSAVFSHKDCRNLRWYEIWDYDPALSKAVTEQWPVDKYVSEIVLPRVEQAKNHAIKTFGIQALTV